MAETNESTAPPLETESKNGDCVFGQSFGDSVEGLPHTTFSPRTGLTIDWDRYGAYLNESSLSDDQKRAFIETLWGLVVSSVDLVLGLHPLQLVEREACGQNPKTDELSTRTPFDLAHSCEAHWSEEEWRSHLASAFTDAGSGDGQAKRDIDQDRKEKSPA